MADGLSVAGSAVGVISLAITTCQGVLSYYNSWDTQDQNISDAKGKIERLRSSLSALEEILPKISSSSAIAVQVEQCVLSCKEGTARLEQFLGKCGKNPAPLSLKDKLRDCRQKAVFPFRQSSLDSLKEIVRDLEGNLGIALQVLQIDTSEAQFSQTSNLVDLTKSTAVLVDGANQGISNVEKKVDIVIGALPQIQQGVAQITSDVPIFRSSMEQSMEQKFRAIENLTSQILPNLQTKLDELPLRIQEILAESTALVGIRQSIETSGLNKMKSAMSTTLTDMDEDARQLQFVLAQRPSLLRNVCDRAGVLEMNIEPISTMTARDRPAQDLRKRKWTKQKPYCSCSTLIRERAATYSIGSVKLFKASVESCKHSITCPLYIGTEATTTVGLKMTYYGRLLVNTMRATISITTGAGGFSISPCLRLRALVPKDSPAFRLIDGRELNKRLYGKPRYQTNEVCEYFESALQQLYELFKNGSASPTDTCEDGSTLFLNACKCASILCNYNVEAVQSFRVLLMGLIAAGVPLNETDNLRRSALNLLASAAVYEHIETRRGQELAELAMKVCEAGAELSEVWYEGYIYYFSVIPHAKEVEIITKYDGWVDDCDYGALSAAILRRSDDDMGRILQSSPQSIHEQNWCGRSPLHLSCNWPKGIALLLRHGGREIIDRPDRRGFLPLAYSCASNCLEAVKLMLEAGSALYSPIIPWNGKSWSVFEEAVRTSTDEIISHLENALMVRRTRLYSLATIKLCRKDLEELKITNDRILDEKAFEVYETLEHRNIPIPSTLRTSSIRTTVFHNQCLSPARRELLYGHGFIDVDGIDYLGLTPLMNMEQSTTARLKTTLQRASWLVSKGADLGRKPGLVDQCERMHWEPSTTAAHYLCSWVSKAMYQQHEFEPNRVSPDITRTWLLEMLGELEEDCQSLLGGLFTSTLYDNCLCACSSHGCNPATIMLKGISQQLDGNMSYKHMPKIPHPIEGRLWVIEWVESLLGHHHEAWRWLSREIVRYETFEKLQLTHTCCEVGVWGYGMPLRNVYMDCEEIRDEERLLISKLEALVAEFQDKYIELGVKVSEFLKGYWKARMEEVEREEEPLDDEEIAKIREVGVVIHS